MICRIALAALVSSFALPYAAIGQTSPALMASLDEAGETITIRRGSQTEPLVTQIAKPGFRPYLHPLVAPDGNGVLTELSPGHHKHQTGLYWGFTRVNGRDYFHHPGADYWRRVSVNVLTAEARSAGDPVQWQTVYDLLGDNGEAILRESQIWTIRDLGDHYEMDLDWQGEAMVDVTIGRYDYGGLFLRMPWKPGIQGQVTNSARQVNARAEGGRAVWLDVGMQVDGRDDLAHIAIFDHPGNDGFPLPWRVDGQMGVGPVRARLGDWSIEKGQTETIRHRLVVYTGDLNNVELTQQWSEFSGQRMAWAQWQLAQQEGREAEFLTPQRAVESMTLQPGFRANVYASEPMLTQPMAFCWDAKGRMWIAENRDYETRGSGFSGDGGSRILILEDTDRDGVADSRKVFLEGIPFPAGIAVGMGGLWLGAPPNLLFVPDRDGDDRADRDDIEVRLTGWGIRDRHETLNSFLWGPDGWLYGCQGFATPSRVGKPAGSGKIYQHRDPFPEEIRFEGEPIDINGGVWRYHPTKDRFEVVAHGFSNPWGIDYDDKGNLFITACVIPHLWHVIPGGIYHRQGGSHFNPFVYRDIQTIADHRHRSAHGGARVYLSDAFPPQYQGRIFMANIHEHAVLTDILEPSGSGFVGHHGDDFALANNAQWIGFSMEIGPQGAVYVLDWHDADICGKDVLNKDTGRVFRFTPETSTAANFRGRYADLTKLPDVDLAEMQRVPSAWHARHARTILQQRASIGSIDPSAIGLLQAMLDDDEPTGLRLRAIWSLHVTAQLQSAELLDLLQDTDPHVRAWSIQLLCEDFDPPPEAMNRFVSMAHSDASPVVRLYLAAAAQRWRGDAGTEVQWQVLEALARHGEDADDHNLPKMIWFALEPLVTTDPARALVVARRSEIPILTRFIGRRLADDQQFATLVKRIDASDESVTQLLLLGLRDALEGRFDMKSPEGWSELYPKLSALGGETAKIALQLSQQFGDSVAAKAMLATLQDRTADLDDRRAALQGLAGRQRDELKTQLVTLLDDGELRRDAIRAIASFDDPTLATALLERYHELPQADKQEVVHTLASRSGYGDALTDAIARGDVPRRDVPAYVARLLRRVVGNRFVDTWGTMETLGAEKEAMFSKYRTLLTPESIARGNASAGRAIFNRTCAACHKMFGHGGNIGPDITGANRTNLEYLLGNILTPSAIIQDDYKMHIILTDDGRIYSGIPASENERQLRLRIADRDEPITIAKSQIESREIAAVSMMPEGTLQYLGDQEVMDLFAYLQSLKQVPLPNQP